MTQAEILAHNRGVAAVIDFAVASARELRAKLKEKPTRYAFAIEALEAIADAGSDLIVTIGKNDSDRQQPQTSG